MDPGTALAVVSLGLEVCKGLLDYYEAWEGYKDTIQDTYSRIADLSKTLALLNDKLQAMQAASPTSQLPVRVAECLTACKDGVQRLDKKLKKLSHEKPTTFTQMAKAGGLRLVYPFRASTLEKLKEIVGELMQSLSLAMQVLVLDNSDEVRNVAIRIEDGIDTIESLATQIHTTAVDTQKQMEATATAVQTLLTTKEANQLGKILDWLSAPDPAINHEEARKKHEPGTGEWLLKCQEYQDWLSGRAPRLWLHGKAGCCKTVLCSTLLEDLRRRLSNQPRSLFAYFYFSFADTRKQSYTALLLSMVTELSRGYAVHPQLQAAFDQSRPNKPRTSALEKVLIALLQQGNVSYLVVDALDECPETDDQREQVMQGLRGVAQEATNTRVLITSRREMDIEEFMQSWCEVRLAINEDNVNADIDIFVKNALANDKKLLRLPEGTKKEIEEIFSQKSDGMFRWAALQLQSIRSLKILRSSYVSATLHNMPRTLDETYTRILASIDDLYADEARTALEWLAFSTRPLSVAELAEACSIRLKDEDDLFLGEGSEDTLEGLLGVVSSLVLVEDQALKPVYGAAENSNGRTLPDETTDFRLDKPSPKKFNSRRYAQRIRLAHFSVKEFLVSSRLRDLPVSKYGLLETEVHSSLAQSCCAYLIQFTNQREIRLWVDEEKAPEYYGQSEFIDETFQDFLEDFTPAYPLLPYAVDQWHVHQMWTENQSNGPPSSARLHLTILREERVRVSWLRLADRRGARYADPRCQWDYGRGPLNPSHWHDGTRALYWASLLGFHQTVSQLRELESRPDVDHVGGKCGTALQAAAYAGHKQIVDVLIYSGANVDHVGGEYGTALHAAAQSGHEKIVQTLVHNGANVDYIWGNYGTALQAAAYFGHEKTVDSLIRHGADVNRVSGEFGNALQAAARSESEKTVGRLLQAGAHVNVTGGRYETALLASVHSGSDGITEMLIQAGADVNGPKQEPPLSVAVKGLERIVKMLIQAGANVNPEEVCDPLCDALEKGRAKIAEMLILAGAHASAGAFRLALQSISDRSESDAIAELLFHSGLDYKGAPDLLTVAAAAGSEKLVKILLDAKADIHGCGTYKVYGSWDKSYGGPLAAAAESGNEKLVQILLDAGANPRVWCQESRHEWKSNAPLTKVVQFGTRASSSCEVQRATTIAQKLLDAGADIHAAGDDALYQVTRNWRDNKDNPGNMAMLRFLLDNGADVNGQCEPEFGDHPASDRGSILCLATISGDINLVQILLDHGGDINAHGWTPLYGEGESMSILSQAARCKNRHMVQFLLDHGADVDEVDPVQAWRTMGASYLLAAVFEVEDADFIVTMMLDAMIRVKGLDNAIFDEMWEVPPQYLKTGIDDFGSELLRMKELLKERRMAYSESENI